MQSVLLEECFSGFLQQSSEVPTNDEKLLCIKKPLSNLRNQSNATYGKYYATHYLHNKITISHKRLSDNYHNNYLDTVILWTISRISNFRV